MVSFIQREAPGIFDAIDDGQQGKPLADIFIDDRALTFGPRGMDWAEIAAVYGSDKADPVLSKIVTGRYRDLVQGLQAQALFAGAGAFIYGRTKVGPLFWFDSNMDRNLPTLMVVSCQHGEEDSGPRVLTKHFADFCNLAGSYGIRLVVYPCVNPEGYDRGERRNLAGEESANSFVEYIAPGGKVLEEIRIGRTPTNYRVASSQAAETKALWCSLELGAAPTIVLDVHQDSMLKAGESFAYTLCAPSGSCCDIARKLNTTGGTYLPNLEMPDQGWTEQKLKTDEYGLIPDLHDGSLTDYLYQRGAELAVCLEVSFHDEDSADQRVVHWIRGLIEYLGKGRYEQKDSSY
jgi:hypothetical protein